MATNSGTLQIIFGILLSISSVTADKSDPQSNACLNSPIDVVVLLDTSDSVDSTTFQTEKNVMKDITSRLLEQNNRFALATIGESINFQFHLNTYKTLNDMTMAIDYLWRSTGQSHLERAIELAIVNGFRGTNGNRKDAPDYVIVVAESETLNKSQFNRISDRLQENMIELVLVGGRFNSANFEASTNIHRFQIPSSGTERNVTEDVITLLCKEKGVLKPWTSWSACGTTCGRGTRRRFKDCVKRRPNDLCLGKKIDSERCMIRNCTDAVDGGWTYWQEWAKCTKTCGAGVQSRRRECIAPVPVNGGKLCKGSELQLKNCSEWKCPNCSQICENGTILSASCDVCECPNTTLYVTILSESNGPLWKVDVYMKAKPYEMLGSTNTTGTLFIYGVCPEHATFIFRKDGYVDMEATANFVNETYFNISGHLERTVSPVILKQPENKFRLMRQNATLCCLADGRPKPQTVQWFKNGEELNVTNEQLELLDLSQSDAGVYSCSVETVAGIVKSQEAYVEVFASEKESCSNPLVSTRKLPENCFSIQNGTNTTIVDLGKCSRNGCITKSFQDNDTCTDLEENDCCDEDQSEDIEVYCSGFSYTLKRVISCACKKCILSTIVEGTAYGKFENGSRFPFAYGYLFINGKRAAVSNEMGYFQFELRRRSKKAVVYFSDEFFQKFVPTTKIFDIQRDSLSYVTVILPLKPQPVHFESHHGISVNLGGSKDFAPAGGLTIPEHALMTADGRTYTGMAKASVHFMDPRKLSDIEAANGNFVYSTEDGTLAPLDTFGMFHTSVEDDNGRQLKITKKLTFSLDVSVFNVSVKDDGTPDLALWKYDINNGIWIETAKMTFSDSSAANGRRKLLDNVLVGEFEVQDIKHIDITEEKPVWDRVIIGYTNCDHSVPIYGERIVNRESKIKGDACFLSVSVYTDLTFTENSDAGTNIVAITQEMYGPKFKGMDSKTTDITGHVCLSVFCNSKVYVYAENKFDGSRLIASTKHDLPFWYKNFNNTKNGTEVEINSYDIEDVMDGGKTRYSPFVPYEDLAKCKSDFDKNYKFQFAYYGMPHTLTTSVAKDTCNKKMSWYPVSPGKPFAKACFIKVSITTEDDNSRFIAESFQNESKKSNLYGTYEVGPSFDLNSPGRKVKGACLEFRCPGRYVDEDKLKYNSMTIVDVTLISSRNCQLRAVTQSLNITNVNGRTGFRFVADPAVNYGPNFGIYVGNGKAEKIRNFCTSGTDTEIVDKFMKPDKNVAAAFTCT